MERFGFFIFFVVCVLFIGTISQDFVNAEESQEKNIQKTSEIFTVDKDIRIENTESIQWINLREEIVMIHTTSVEKLFERGYLIDREVYMQQKNNPHIKIFDPTNQTHSMTEKELQLLNIPNPNNKDKHFWLNEKSEYVVPENVVISREEHAHASILVRIFGDKFDFSKSDYQIKSPWIHFEGQDGSTIHKHAAGVPLGFLFDSIGIGLDDHCYVFNDGRQFCSNDDYSLKFYINGHKVESIIDHIIENNDRILISYGAESEEEIKEHLLELDLQDIIA